MKFIKLYYQSIQKLAMLAILATSLMHCPGSSFLSNDDDDKNEYLLLGLLPQQCLIGGVSFVNSGARCGAGSASGSGTLTAVGTRSEFLSLQLNFQLLSSASTIQVVGGGQSGIVANSTTSNYFQLGNTTSSIHANGSTTLAGAGTSARSWCMEMHFEENPDHLIIDTNPCTTRATSLATADEETNSLETSGGNWGIVLNNATVSGLIFNNSEMFTD